MDFYRACCDMFIRPPRDEYSQDDLGLTEFQVGSRLYERTDLELMNPRELTLVCSLWQPKKNNRPRQKIPCILYLHGNCGSRMDALDCLDIISAYGIGLFTMDFAGAGQSEGDYISLGYHERRDVETAMEYLQGLGTVSAVALWGRSMGAATSLLYAAETQNPNLRCLILDSPFSSLHEVASEVGETIDINLPRAVVSNAVSMGLGLVRRSIKNKAKFDIRKVSPAAVAKDAKIPAIFLHGEDDTFIAPKHSTEIYGVYGGLKELLLVPGDHNTPRTGVYFQEISRFLYDHLLDQSFKELIDLPSPVLPTSWNLQKGERWFLGKMLKSQSGPVPFNVVMIVTRQKGIILHPPFSFVDYEVIGYNQIRAYGMRDESFVFKWVEDGCVEEEAGADEIDMFAAQGVQILGVFFGPETYLVLETVERVLEDLLSTKMGVENIDQIIEEVVREKESSGKTFTRDEILQSIDDRVMKKKAGPAVPSDSPSPSSSSPPSSSSSSSSS
eukprot:CAMPEP_0201483242 /NCGR_PEP_ID=MMETSP0151_2-20130828/7463_1 /ASSEMBLY_ACC=CAM_ASM_000257 /TAXON_ID=200890 /ORGANISM="Paramoeba atlantica, Strain 621/1 / CCAP 1560/9" /LENGTH=499 /DNA_ID=CAMNT_0047866299 /DNA_START=109 /DNA_END=1605 /DNA_ORIENTATION=+